ncbi:MAG: DUF4833 domain-containing protein [Elusimicrobia bacterium]|nr:DUF4833 domain-containing protein [Candidatus Liberimonas magnetica]
MKRFVYIIVFVMLSVNVFGAQTNQLFVIGRSKNANIVRYDANVGADGKIDQKQPVAAYWLLLAKDGKREELSAMDRKAYGFQCDFDKNTGVYKLLIKSFDKREIKVYHDKKMVRAEMVINGKPAYLNKVFITASGALIPKVESIELYGKDKKNGKTLHEKIKV